VIVLDTNVISELMRSQPHPAVTAWVAAQSRGSLYTTSVNEAELFYSISAMPEGRAAQRPRCRGSGASR